MILKIVGIKSLEHINQGKHILIQINQEGIIVIYAKS